MSKPHEVNGGDLTMEDVKDFIPQPPVDELPEELKTKFPPKTIVLAKVKGYPNWPAMILEESILPLYVKLKKPKATKTKKRSIFYLPVRFFSDDTYIWIKTDDIKLLTEDVIDEYLSKTRKDKMLTYAYELAKDPLDMDLFVKYGSRGEPAPVVTPSEEELNTVEPNGNKKPVGKKRGRKPNPNTEANKKAKLEKLKQEKKQQKEQKQKQKEQDHLDLKKKNKKIDVVKFEYDDDWGVDDDLEQLFETGNYIFDDKLQQLKFNNEFPTSKEIINEVNYYQEWLNQLTNEFFNVYQQDQPHQLSVAVEENGGNGVVNGHVKPDITNGTANDVTNESHEPELITIVNRLNDKTIPTSIMIKSKLFKLLVTICRIKHCYPQLKQTINAYFQSNFDLQVMENPEVMEPEPTPELALSTSTPGPLEPAITEPEVITVE